MHRPVQRISRDLRVRVRRPDQEGSSGAEGTRRDPREAASRRTLRTPGRTPTTGSGSGADHAAARPRWAGSCRAYRWSGSRGSSVVRRPRPHRRSRPAWSGSAARRGAALARDRRRSRSLPRSRPPRQRRRPGRSFRRWFARAVLRIASRSTSGGVSSPARPMGGVGQSLVQGHDVASSAGLSQVRRAPSGARQPASGCVRVALHGSRCHRQGRARSRPPTGLRSTSARSPPAAAAAGSARPATPAGARRDRPSDHPGPAGRAARAPSRATSACATTSRPG